jgi:4-hydroxy-3-methylbut-2-enyl diphosphate reductase
MKVLRAGVLGFCMGVRRAVKMAEAELAARPAAGNRPPVFSLGPLIHNPQTLASLKGRGLVVLDEEAAAANGQAACPPCRDQPSAGQGQTAGSPDEKPVVIIRAHGVSPRVEENLLLKGFRIVDATCPRVKASQNTALALASRGLTVFIAGEKNHAEVKGIAGYVEAGSPRKIPVDTARPPETVDAAGRPARCIIVGSAAEAETAAETLRRERPDAETALIAQTTFSEDEYERIETAVKKRFPGLEVKDTICGATRERQNALRELCAACDAVIVAGGRDSANTRRLLAIAGQYGKPCWLAETAADLPPELKNHAVAGLCAGASTPDGVIEEIANAMENAGLKDTENRASA